MTFASETVRQKYHELPTEQQVLYKNLAVLLLRTDQFLHITGVEKSGVFLHVHSDPVYGLGRVSGSAQNQDS